MTKKKRLIMANKIFGTCSEQIKVLTTEEVKMVLTRLAYDEDMSLSEYMNNILLLHVYGEERILKVTQDRIKRMGRRGTK